MEFTLHEYEELLQKLRKNRENVPLEQLKTKYAKPYNELLQKIKKHTSKIMLQFLFSGMPLKPRTKEDPEDAAVSRRFLEAAKRIINEEQQAGVFGEISRAVFLEYSIEKALDIAAEKIYPRILYEAYAPYWLRHCSIRMDQGYIYNDLIQMMWVPKWNVWISHDGTELMLMLPPTMELIKKERMSYGTEKSDGNRK